MPDEMVELPPITDDDLLGENMASIMRILRIAVDRARDGARYHLTRHMPHLTPETETRLLRDGMVHLLDEIFVSAVYDE